MKKSFILQYRLKKDANELAKRLFSKEWKKFSSYETLSAAKNAFQYFKDKYIRDFEYRIMKKCKSCSNGIIYDALYDKWFECSECKGKGVK